MFLPQWDKKPSRLVNDSCIQACKTAWLSLTSVESAVVFHLKMSLVCATPHKVPMPILGKPCVKPQHPKHVSSLPREWNGKSLTVRSKVIIPALKLCDIGPEIRSYERMLWDPLVLHHWMSDGDAHISMVVIGQKDTVHTFLTNPRPLKRMML